LHGASKSGMPCFLMNKLLELNVKYKHICVN
jgi:hypothetical protein